MTLFLGAVSAGVPLRYLFDRFELDDDNRCLSRDGQRLALEPKTLSVLSLMVRSGGKLLTKEAILDAVWKQTVVEESSLSRAVALLRKQLGDDARNPAFIETVPTLGYRFIAVVRAALPPDEAGPAPPIAAGVRAAPLGRDAPAPRSRQRWGGPRIGWGLAAVLVLCAVAGAVWFMGHRGSLPARQSIVLAEFENSTGDPVFDGTLRQGMRVQLDQSPLLNLVSEQRIRAALAFMGQPLDARLTPAIAREICQRTGGAAVLAGSIASLGGQYVIGLRATECRSGDVLDSEQVQARRKEDVLQALDQIASRFRARVGESLTSVANRDTPLAAATTSSLEALQALSEANRVQNAQGSAAAIPFYQRAIALDPQFAIAHAMLGRMYGDIGQESKSAESTAEAYRYRDRSSERERFFIVSSYETQVTGNLELAEQTCATWARVYPDDAGSLGFPAGLILRVFGRYDEAVEKSRRLIEREPDFAMAWHLLVINDIALGHLAAADAALEHAAARQLEIPVFTVDRLRLAFLRGNAAEEQRLTLAAADQPATLAYVSGEEAAALAYVGRASQARDVARRAVTVAVQLGRRDAAARLEAASAIRESLFGNTESAARAAKAALGLSNGRDAEFGAAFALALLHDATAARLADDLDKRFPNDTSVHYHYAPALRALELLQRGAGVEALEVLRVNTPYELGLPPSNFLAFYGAMYPVFVRGEVYVALHRHAEAIAEFQKILDHPAVVGSDPVGAWARLELARAWQLAGDKSKAKAAYASFLDLWKDADADMPTLAAAEAEFARL